MSTPLRVLILEDSEDDAHLVLREIQRGDYEVIHTQVETAEAMQAALAEGTWDLVISDYSMPSFNAPAALAVLKDSGLDLPFIIVSGTIGENSAVSALKAGANDFLLKGNLARLIPAIQRELREAEVRRASKRAEAALQASERQLALIYGTVSDVLYYLAVEPDERFRFLSINPAFLEATGLTADQVIGKVVQDVIPEPAHALVLGYYKEAIQKKQTVRWEEVSAYPAGTRHGEVSVTPVFDADGNCTHLIGSVHDITERKRAEERIRRQVERLSALRQIDTAISASLDLRLTLRIMLEQVTKQLAVDAADVLLFNPHIQTLEYAAGRGFRSKAIEGSRVRLGQGYAGRAALERARVGLPDLDEEEPDLARAPLLEGEDFHAYYAEPLLVKGQVKGVLEAFHRTPLKPDDEWLDFLETLAGQAAIAIDNALLFDDLQHSNLKLITAYDTTIEGWSHALDLRDKETEGHTQRVTEMTLRLARAMGISEAEIVHIRRGALLHDIGKMGIPDHILLKPGALTEDEWAIMRQHPVYAHQLLSPIVYLRPALDIPYCHHEKWDGTGYPRGLKGDEIPLSARLFAVVDVWDALRSDRPYRAAWSKDKVLEHIRSLVGTHFDPQVVDVFLSALESLSAQM